jgi:mono/diheme cytochrome c family protein
MLNTKLFFGLLFFLLGWSNKGSSSHFQNFILNNDYSSQNKIVIRQSQSNGKEIYTDFCIQCHGANGKGDGKNFPPLDGSDWLSKKRTQSIYGIKFGQSGEIIVNKIKFNNIMPAMGLSNEEVADVMNYIMNSWSNKHKRKVTVKEVEGIKKLN